jgi:hypothetical protein
VLEQQRNEPLEAAEDRPVDDHRPVLGVVQRRCTLQRQKRSGIW